MFVNALETRVYFGVMVESVEHEFAEFDVLLLILKFDFCFN